MTNIFLFTLVVNFDSRVNVSDSYRCLIGCFLNEKLFFRGSCSLIIMHEGVWYMANILYYRPRSKAVSGYNPQPWYIGHIPHPLVPYCYYKLVTNVIRTVKSTFFVIPVKCCFSQSASRTQTMRFIIFVRALRNLFLNLKAFICVQETGPQRTTLSTTRETDSSSGMESSIVRCILGLTS